MHYFGFVYAPADACAKSSLSPSMDSRATITDAVWVLDQKRGRVSVGESPLCLTFTAGNRLSLYHDYFMRRTSMSKTSTCFSGQWRLHTVLEQSHRPQNKCPRSAHATPNLILFLFALRPPSPTTGNLSSKSPRIRPLISRSVRKSRFDATTLNKHV